MGLIMLRPINIESSGGAQIGIKMEMFVYKWLPLVIGGIILIEIVFIYYWLSLVNQADQVQVCIKSYFRIFLTMVAELHLLQ